MEPMLQLINRITMDQEMELRRELERKSRCKTDELMTKPNRAAKPEHQPKPSGEPRRSDNPWGFRLRRRPTQETL